MSNKMVKPEFGFTNILSNIRLALGQGGGYLGGVVRRA